MDQPHQSVPRSAHLGGTRVGSAHSSPPAAGVREIEKPQILDGVEDQFGKLWMKYGSATRSCWFALNDLHLNDRDVFSRLSGPGTTLLTPTSRNAFKRAVEQRTTYRPALVAAHPGWLGESFIFVLGDGSVIAPRESDCPEVIVVFEPHHKFVPRGALGLWKARIGPVVTGQPLPLFVLGFAFIGPLLRFAPSHVINPLCELVGRNQCGKSTLAFLAASVWAGDPDSETGGAASWDATLNVLDPLKAAHADGLLVLDEANLAGGTKQEQRQLIEKAVFKLASTGGKQRLTDITPPPDIRLATLSTSNEPLADLVQGALAVREAAQSRMATVRIPNDGSFEALRTLPAGFTTSREAMEHLRIVIDEQYGTAGRRFVRRLVREAARDKKALRATIAERFEWFLQKAKSDPASVASARLTKMLAMTFVAGSLARQWNILPKNWGSLSDAILEVQRSMGRPAAASSQRALKRVQDYAETHAKKLIRLADLEEPFEAATFARMSGFLRPGRHGEQELLIPSQRFQRDFPDFREVMSDLREAGLAQTEGGKKPKLTIKAPSGLCDGGRVYCIRFGGKAAVKRRESTGR